MNARDRREIARLIVERRWGALATLREDGTPLASQVAYAAQPANGSLLMHLSELAEHTRNLLVRPAVALLIGEPDLGGGDPQTLSRLCVCGDARILQTGDDYEAAKTVYLDRLPHAAPRFDFTDFMLVRLDPQGAQFVGGFARATSVDGAELARIIMA